MATPQAITFKYKSPEELRRPMTFMDFVEDDHMVARVMVIKDHAGETNLHAHTNMDGFWWVLSGRAKFYTTDNEVVGEFGPGEGVYLPRDYPNWFESIGDDVLEILQVATLDTTIAEGHGRVDLEPAKPHFGASERVERIKVGVVHGG